MAATKIPDNLSFVDGSTFPIAMATDGARFYLVLDFPRMLGKREKRNEGMLVLGGALSVETAIVQLGNLTEYKVFTTASEKHHEDPEVVRNIIEEVSVSDVDLTLRFDVITENDTPQFSANVLSATGYGDGKLILTLPWPENMQIPKVFNGFLKDAFEKKYIIAALPVEIVEGSTASAQKAFDMKEGASGKELFVMVE